MQPLPLCDTLCDTLPLVHLGGPWRGGRAQLEELVAYALKEGSIIVFDAAYAPFIRDKGIPKSIYEISGAEACAIEVNSFSKYAGFTGVRLGWTIVPNGLKFADGSNVRDDYNRVMTTAFNGASNIVQGGGLACLDAEGLTEIEALIEYYLGNAKILREAVLAMGFDAHGGTDSPYVFVDLKVRGGTRVVRARRGAAALSRRGPHSTGCGCAGREFVGHVLPHPRRGPGGDHPRRGLRPGRGGVPSPQRLCVEGQLHRSRQTPQKGLCLRPSLCAFCARDARRLVPR